MSTIPLTGLRPLAALAALLALAAPARAQASPDDAPAARAPAARAALGLADPAAARAYADGRAALLELRLDDARAAFARVTAAEPTSAAGPFGAQSAALVDAVLAEDAAAARRFDDAHDAFRAHAERLPPSASRDLLLATGVLHRAVLLAREERYARAALAFRDACGRFRRLDAGGAAPPDVHFGRGVCEVVAGSIPRRYRLVGRALGFSGTVAGGLERLGRAAAAPGAFDVEAVAVFASADRSLNRAQGGGAARLAALAAAYPASPLVLALWGTELLVDRRPAEAEAALVRARAALARAQAPLPFVDADLATARMRLDRPAEALPLFDAFERAARGPARRAQTLLAAGLAAELTGDRAGAVARYRRVRAARDYDSDHAAAREAARRAAAPMTPAERELVGVAHAFDRRAYADALARAQPLAADAAQPAAVRAEAAYRAGRALVELGRPDEALAHFAAAAERPGDPLARWGPWSLLHTGEIHEAATRTDPARADAARAAYRAALAAEAEFDFHTALEQRARAALARLGR